MNWQKITEYAMAGVITMLMGAAGTALSWGMLTLSQHDRALADKSAEIKILQHELELTRERDKELITMMAEELKKLQEHIQEMKDLEQPTPIAPQPFSLPKKEPKKKWPEQKVEDYQHILRDKFEQRTEQLQLKEK